MSKDKYFSKNNFYIFDIDENLFYLPTKVHLEQKINEKWIGVELNSAEFREVRHELLKFDENSNLRYLNNDINQVFCEFGDLGERGDRAFIEDVKFAFLC